MENITTTTTQQNIDDRHLVFTGKGGKFFGIWVVNILLTIITLGLYYPWAKIAIRKYIWNETSLNNDRFVFHGKGIEILKGFLIIYALLIIFIVFISNHPQGILLFYLIVAAVVPLAIFGGWRYRVSKTSWRGIYFSFDGNFTEFLKIYFTGLLFLILTFGLYSSWFRVKIMKYLFKHTRLGQYRFSFSGHGDELFGINFLGVFLSMLTLYIYIPWYMKNRFNFTVNNTVIHHNDKKSKLRSTLEGSKLFGVLLVNILIIIFTLGIGFPWARMRYYKILFENIHIPKDVNLDELEQNKIENNDATGDSLLDFLDVGIDF